MRSGPHFLVSVAIGLAVAAWADPAVGTVPLVLFAGALGVAIDLDHFPIARYNSGSWAALRGCLRRPWIVLLDQSAIFEPREVRPLQRLLTHLVLGGLLVGALVPLDGLLAATAALVLYGHVLADLVHDNLTSDPAG